MVRLGQIIERNPPGLASPGHWRKATFTFALSQVLKRLLTANVAVGAPSQPDVSIVLTDYVDGGPQDKDIVAGLLAKGAMNGVHFSTPDLEGVFDRVKAAGAEVVEEPADQPWGARDGAVRDPSGNLVRINQTAA